MYFNFIFFNLLNLLFLSVIYSSYNNFILNVEFLLFIVFTFIILNFFLYTYNLLNDFLVLKKNELLKEYFYKFLDLYQLLNVLKQKIINIIKKFDFVFHLKKFICLFFEILSLDKLRIISKFCIYSYNNILTFYVNSYLFLKKNLLIFLFEKKIIISNSYKFILNIFLQSKNFDVFYLKNF